MQFIRDCHQQGWPKRRGGAMQSRLLTGGGARRAARAAAWGWLARPPAAPTLLLDHRPLPRLATQRCKRELRAARLSQGAPAFQRPSTLSRGPAGRGTIHHTMAARLALLLLPLAAAAAAQVGGRWAAARAVGWVRLRSAPGSSQSKLDAPRLRLLHAPVEAGSIAQWLPLRPPCLLTRSHPAPLGHTVLPCCRRRPAAART